MLCWAGLLLHGRVDPGGEWHFGWRRRDVFEAFRVGQECRIEGDRALPGNFCGVTAVHVFRGHETDTGMPMHGVVPSEEGLTVSPRILDRAEAVREVRAVLEGLELRFGIRIVVRDVRTAMGFGDIEID